LRLSVSGINSGETVTLDDVFIYQGVSVTLASVKHSCNGASDGAISVTTTCGGPSALTFAWTGPDSYTNDQQNISGLAPGSYSLVVTDDYGTATLGPITINETSAVILTVGGQNWSCLAGTGFINASASGGTAPYIFSLNSTVGIPPFQNQAGAAGGLVYTVSVVDANGCTAPDQTFTIYLDNAGPTGCDYPPDAYYSLNSYEARSGVEAIDPQPPFSSYPYDRDKSPTHIDSTTFFYQAGNYTNLQFSLSASQSNVTTWSNADYIEVSYSLDGSIWTPFFRDDCRWEGVNGGACDNTPRTTPLQSAWITIPGAVNGQEFYLLVRIYSNAADKGYTIQSLLVQGRNVYAALPASYTGSPSACVDNYSSVVLNSTDQPITWLCYDPAEFYFTRTWSPVDACSNATDSHNQRISVGTAPYFTYTNNDTTINFCNNVDVEIPIPEFDDACDSDPTISWAVTTNGTNVSPSSGTPGATDTHIQLTFPQPVTQDTTYTITWTITDAAGFTATDVQNVVITRPMAITLTPILPASGDFCTGEEARFRVQVVGGTGSYNMPTITPDGTLSGAPNDVTYTTSGLTLLSNEIQVNYVDLVIPGIVGGCTATAIFTSGEGVFTIHEKIWTNPINRVP
jgi:hypothetical protein